MIENEIEYKNNRINELQMKVGRTRKVISMIETEVQGLRASVLSSLRNTEKFDTQNDRSRHTTRLAKLLHIIETIELRLKEIKE